MSSDRAAWGLYSRVADDGTVEDYSGAALPVDRLPPSAEISADGKWATVYRQISGRSVPVAVFVRLDGGGPLASRRPPR